MPKPEATTVLDLAKLLLPNHNYAKLATRTETHGDVLGEMPLNSTCGDDCAKLITAAHAFVAGVRAAHGHRYDTRLVDAVDLAIDACLVYIRG